MNDYLRKPSTHTIGIEKEISHPVLIVSTVVLLGARLCCISKEKKKGARLWGTFVLLLGIDGILLTQFINEKFLLMKHLYTTLVVCHPKLEQSIIKFL